MDITLVHNSVSCQLGFNVSLLCILHTESERLLAILHQYTRTSQPDRATWLTTNHTVVKTFQGEDVVTGTTYALDQPGVGCPYPWLAFQDKCFKVVRHSITGEEDCSQGIRNRCSEEQPGAEWWSYLDVRDSYVTPVSSHYYYEEELVQLTRYTLPLNSYIVLRAYKKETMKSVIILFNETIAQAVTCKKHANYSIFMSCVTDLMPMNYTSLIPVPLPLFTCPTWLITLQQVCDGRTDCDD